MGPDRDYDGPLKEARRQAEDHLTILERRPLPPIIGVCGDIGSGKDAVAEALEQQLGYVRAAFADKLKECVAQMFPWIPREHFFGTQKQKAAALFIQGGKRYTGRRLLEEIGQAARDAYPDVWLKVVMDRIDASDPWRWVIPDVRHANEFDAIHARGGVVWEVQRIGGPATEHTGHVSDHAWRALRKDATLTARFGDLAALKDLAVRLAKSGGR